MSPTRTLIILTLAAGLLGGGCRAKEVSVTAPVPPQALAAKVPGDISSERLSLVIDEVTHTLKPRFGPLTSVAYRVPAAIRWDDVERFYSGALQGRMQAVTDVYREGRRHRLGVWSADGSNSKPMLAVAFVENPVSGETAAHGVLIVLTTPQR